MEERSAIIIGTLLAFLGVLGYFGTGQESITALIPLFFGIPIGFLGALAIDNKRRKFCMHIVAVLAVLGVVGTLRVIPQVVSVITGAPRASKAAILSQVVMLGLCGLLLAVCIQSFIRARKRREIRAHSHRATT